MTVQQTSGTEQNPSRTEMGDASTRETKVAVRLGGLMVLAGALVVLGYGVYYFSKVFFGSHDIPLPVRVAVPAVVVGFLLVMVAVLLERLRSGKREKFEEVEF